MLTTTHDKRDNKKKARAILAGRGRRTLFLICPPPGLNFKDRRARDQSQKGGGRTDYVKDARGRRRFLWFFLPLPSICFSPVFPLVKNSDPGSQSRCFSLLPTTVLALTFYRENSSSALISSLVDSHRITPSYFTMLSTLTSLQYTGTEHARFLQSKQTFIY